MSYVLLSRGPLTHAECQTKLPKSREVACTEATEAAGIWAIVVAFGQRHAGEP